MICTLRRPGSTPPATTGGAPRTPCGPTRSRRCLYLEAGHARAVASESPMADRRTTPCPQYPPGTPATRDLSGRGIPVRLPREVRCRSHASRRFGQVRQRTVVLAGHDRLVRRCVGPRSCGRLDMTATPTAEAAGTIDIGGDLTVNRMGFGAMRITGKGIWGARRTGMRLSGCCAVRSKSASTSSTPQTPTAQT